MLEGEKEISEKILTDNSDSVIESNWHFFSHVITPIHKIV